MPLVQSTDYPNKRIYLGPDSVGIDVLPIDVYKEMRERRRLNEFDRQFSPMITAFGNDPAGPTNTPRFTVLSQDVRIVPYDTSHSLSIIGSIISTSESLAGRDLFDRSPLTTGIEVDVDYQPPQVEIIRIETGISGLTEQESNTLLNINSMLALVNEIHRINGLDATAPLIVTQSTQTAGDIVQDITGDGETSSTVTRRDD